MNRPLSSWFLGASTRLHVAPSILDQLFDKVVAEASNSSRDLVTIAADVEDSDGYAYFIEVTVHLYWRAIHAPDGSWYDLDRIKPLLGTCTMQTFDKFGDDVPNDFDPENFYKLFKN